MITTYYGQMKLYNITQMVAASGDEMDKKLDEVRKLMNELDQIEVVM
jgi:hypothetical protein